MKSLIRIAILTILGCCSSIAGVEGLYKATETEMTLNLLPNGEAHYRLVTPLNLFGSEMTITSESNGKWVLEDGKVTFQGDVLFTTSAKDQPDKTETKPLLMTLSVEENGDLVVIPSKDVLQPTRLSKQK